MDPAVKLRLLSSNLELPFVSVVIQMNSVFRLACHNIIGGV